MDPVKAKANFARICQLLVDKGGEALRRVLHAKIWPSDLVTVLTSKKSTLKKLRSHVINDHQWELLYPSSGIPDSETFDITLLTILIRNICGLPPPAKGWKSMPPVSDCSVSANILRIKLYRNEVYGHIARAHYDNATFEKLWHGISQPLIKLLVHRDDINKLKVTPLSPEEEIYIEKLVEWKNREDVLLREMKIIKEEVAKLRESVENAQSSKKVEHLAKFNFTGKIDDLCKKFQDGTREWFFEKLSTWFNDEESRVTILTAGPGIGKSVLCAKACQLYNEEGRLAAYHFCDYRSSDYKNPFRILQSLASQMCDNIDGFRDKLTETLRREHSRDSLLDVFHVFLNDPLHALNRNQPMVMVIDALDESKTDFKSEFLELISDEFPRLPKWMKILISSRPELQVKKELEHFNPLEIHPDDRNHENDLKQFIQRSLPNLVWVGKVNFLVQKCSGSFLYAYYLVTELKSSHMGNELKSSYMGIEANLSDYVPKGISGFYEKQFKRLRTGLGDTKPRNTFKSFVNVVAASEEPLPIKIVLRCMDLSVEEYEVRNAIVNTMSEVLPVYDNCLTVYHKSLRDWLMLDGYEEHVFAADVVDGIKRLWRVCKNIITDIESRKSISDVKCSPEIKFALDFSSKYLVTNINDIKEFQWLVNIRLNFLKIKFFGKLNVDYYRILRMYKSQLSDEMYWKIFQHNAFLSYVHRDFNNVKDSERKCSIYLHFFANGYFDFGQNKEYCKNMAKNLILNEISGSWLKKITHFSNSNYRIISSVAVENDLVSVMELSPDKELVVFLSKLKLTAEVFKLPGLTPLFKVNLHPLDTLQTQLKFSPDSSYFIFNSISSCISINEKREVPFISHDSPSFQSCSFSSCGLKLITLEQNVLRLWDVREKCLLAQTLGQNVDKCVFSSCNNFVYGFHKYVAKYIIWDSTTLNALDASQISPQTCFQFDDKVRVISDGLLYFAEPSRNWIHLNLPTGEKVRITPGHCSMPFTWKDRKCVIPSTFSSTLAVYDSLTQQVVDTFQFCFLPPGNRISCIGKLGETDFLIMFGSSQVLLLSLKTSETSISPCNVDTYNEEPIGYTFSPDNLYFVCGYENGVLKIVSVDNGETLQTIDLKQRPLACYWSKFYLWVACKNGIIKLHKASTNKTILENALVEFSVKIDRVLKFVEGILVFQSWPNTEICILKILDEEMQQYQKISDGRYTGCSVAISSDGCAFLLHREASEFELWEINCENTWQLVSRRVLKADEKDEHFWFCLTGTHNSRVMVMLNHDHIFSLNISNGTQMPQKCKLVKEFQIHYASDVIYVAPKFLIFGDGSCICFIDLLSGETISTLHVCLNSMYISHLALRGAHLFVVDKSDIGYFTIQNIENCLQPLLSQKNWQLALGSFNI